MGKLGYIIRCIAHMDYSALFDTVKQVHKLSGKPRAAILADIVSCGFKYGAGYKDYLLCEFYNLNSEQRAAPPHPWGRPDPWVLPLALKGKIYLCAH